MSFLDSFHTDVVDVVYYTAVAEGIFKSYIFILFVVVIISLSLS